MNAISKLFINDKNIARQTYFWNMVSGMLSALQSTIVLMVLTRTVGIIEAGIFTIAFSKASLFCKIGDFGIYNFQATDIKSKYKFNDYFGANLSTWIVMIGVSLISSIYGYFAKGYSLHKALIVFMVCGVISIAPLENVFVAGLQLKGRLDVGAKITSTRMIIGFITLTICLIATHNFLFSIIVYLLTHILVFLITVPNTYKVISNTNIKPKFSNVFKILSECFVIFLSSFLLLYTTNSPKYAIDAFSTEKIQAIYGFVAMPVFFIDLLSSFIYKPLYNSYANNWSEKKYSVFIKQILKLIVAIILLTGFVLLVAYFIGIPILSLLYNTELAPYKYEMLILLISGGLMAIASYLMIIATVMRKQNYLIISYSITAVFAYFISRYCVQNFGIKGAAYSFLICISIQVLLSSIIFIILFRKEIVKNRINA